MALTQPTATGTESTFVQLFDTVPPNDTVSVDGVSADDLSVKWIIQVKDPINQLIVTFELLALNKFGASTEHTIYGRLGDLSINYTVDVAIDNVSSPIGGMTLLITNNSAFTLEVVATRIKIE